MRKVIMSRGCGLAVVSMWHKLLITMGVCAQSFLSTVAAWVQASSSAQVVQVLYAGLYTKITNFSSPLSSFLSTVYTGLTIGATNYIN